MITEEEVPELCFGPILFCEDGPFRAGNVNRQTNVTCSYSAALPESAMADTWHRQSIGFNV